MLPLVHNSKCPDSQNQQLKDGWVAFKGYVSWQCFFTANLHYLCVCSCSLLYVCLYFILSALSLTFVCLLLFSFSIFFEQWHLVCGTTIIGMMKNPLSLPHLTPCKAMNLVMQALPSCVNYLLLYTRAHSDSHSCRARPQHNSGSLIIDQMLIVGHYIIVTEVGELTRWLWDFWGMARWENCTVWGCRITATHSIIVSHLHINWGHRHNAQQAVMCIYSLRVDVRGNQGAGLQCHIPSHFTAQLCQS